MQFTNNLEIPQLTEDMRDKLEGPLTYEECKEASSSFSKDKSPGEDGFTAEFYINFFDILGEDLVRSLNHAYEKGELSISQRRGVITLLPKDEASLLDLKNWPPITLLNVDYKIAAKAIATRMETTLPFLIHTDQTGFIKGRYIGENIRLICDLLEQTKTDKSSGILLSIDFRKAFDSVERPIALFTVTFSYLHDSVFERGCEAISGKKCKIARNCLTSTFKYIVMQMRKGNCEKGYYA